MYIHIYICLHVHRYRKKESPAWEERVGTRGYVHAERLMSETENATCHSSTCMSKPTTGCVKHQRE